MVNPDPQMPIVGTNRAAKITEAIDKFRESLKTVPTERLMSVEFAVETLPQMPHHIFGKGALKPVCLKALDAGFSRRLIQQELDNREAGKLGYGVKAMYVAMDLTESFDA